MRVVFLGNAPGYSEHFAEALVRRSTADQPSATLVVIVCPQRQVSRRLGKHFGLVVRCMLAVERRFGQGIYRRLFGRRGGVYLVMRRLAEQCGVLGMFPESVDAVLDEIVALRPDLCIVAGLNRILKAKAIERLPPIFNIHPSLLPAYRGGTPEFWHLADGVEQGGVTLHRIDPGIDTGPIVMQRSFPIPPWIDIDELGVLNVQAGLALLDEFLDGLPETAQHSVAQSDQGFYRPFPGPLERIAPFDGGADAVFNRHRAYGWPSALIVHVEPADWQGGVALGTVEPTATTRILRLFDPVPFAQGSADPPGLLRATGSGGATLACKTGTVLFRRVQLE
ncbi:MAG: methionyl-tRNA formyltransferase [Methylococcus sp.]|jgi:methionyl-tRNA formyltransferase